MFDHFRTLCIKGLSHFCRAIKKSQMEYVFMKLDFLKIKCNFNDSYFFNLYNYSREITKLYLVIFLWNTKELRTVEFYSCFYMENHKRNWYWHHNNFASHFYIKCKSLTVIKQIKMTAGNVVVTLSQPINWPQKSKSWCNQFKYSNKDIIDIKS